VEAQAQAVVEQLTKSRTIFRRAAYLLGFASLCGPILLNLAFSFNGGGDRNFFSYTAVLIAAATPTMLPLAFTFVPLALALKRRARALKEAVDNDLGFEGVITALKKDAKILIILGSVLALAVIIPVIIFIATKDIRVEVPLRPGECCLQPDGTSGQYSTSTSFNFAAAMLSISGPYALVMGTLSFLAWAKTKKRTKQVIALQQVN
jgi:hypothetical protein